MKSKGKKYCRKRTAMILVVALIVSSFAMLPERSYAESLSDITVGDFIDVGKTDAEGYAGIPHWRVLAKDSDGSILLMSEYLWTGDGRDPYALLKYYRSDGEPADSGWSGSRAKEWCQEFEEAVLKNSEGFTIKKIRKTDNEYEYVSVIYPEAAPKYFQGEHNNTLYDDTVFFLSAEELVQYLPDNADRKAYKPDKSGTGDWMLRSRQRELLYCSHVISENGEPSFNMRHDAKYARPVFWAEFTEGTNFVSSTDETGAKTWTICESNDEPQEEPQVEPKPQTDPERRVKSVKSVTVNAKTVNGAVIDKAVKKAGGSNKYVTKIILGSKVKNIKAKAFSKYAKVTVLEVKTKKLTKKSVRKSLKNSKIKTILVKVAKKTKTNKTYVKRYKKIFTKKNAGRKVNVRK